MEQLTRREIRYVLFRLQTEADGGTKATPDKEGPMRYVDEIKSHMQDQEYFGGWRNFAKTWDVDEKAPLVAVARTRSIQSEWNKVLEKEAKPLPTKAEQKKFLENKLAKKVQEKKTTLEQLPPKEVAAAQGTAPLPGKTQPEEKQFLQNDLKAKVQEKKSHSRKKSFWDKLK